MHLKTSTSRTLLTAGLGAAICVSVAGPAVAEASIVGVGPGTLLAKGAVATVPVSFVCDAGEPFALGFGLRQRINGQTITDGGSQAQGTCTGETQTVTLQVSPSPVAFKRGTAAALVTLYDFCADLGFYCTQTDTAREVTLR